MTPRRTPDARTRRPSGRISTGSLPAASTGGTPARTDLRAYVASLTPGHARSSVTQRLAAIRTFHLWAAREGLVDGDPWGSVVRPRLSGRLPRVLETDDILRMLAVVDAELDADGATPTRRPPWPCATGRSIETAYAAGLRISELAGAELASLDLARARCASSARVARSGWGCSGGPAKRALRAYLEDGRPVLLQHDRPMRRCRPRSSSTTTAIRSGFAACAIGWTGSDGSRGCPRGSHRTRCDTRSRRTCSTAARTCEWSRSCSATRTWRPPRSTRTCSPTRLRAAYRDAHPRAGASRLHEPSADDRPRRADRTGRVPGVPDPRLRAGHRSRGSRRSAQLDTFFAAFRIPDLIFQLVAAGPVLGPDPDRDRRCSARTRRHGPGGSSRPSSTSCSSPSSCSR